MVELKLRRTNSEIKAEEIVFVWKEKGPIRFSQYEGKEYLILGKRELCNKADRNILSIIFGDEIVYTKNNILVPRDFFFI